MERCCPRCSIQIDGFLYYDTLYQVVSCLQCGYIAADLTRERRIDEGWRRPATIPAYALRPKHYHKRK